MVKEIETTSPKLVNQPTYVPTNKVTAQAVGATLTAVILSIVQEYFGIGFESGSVVHQVLPILIGAIAGFIMKDFANVPPVKEG